MYTDLVRATGFQFAPHVAKRLPVARTQRKSLQYMIVSYGIPNPPVSIRCAVDRHFFAIGTVSADAQAHRSLVLFDVAEA